MRSTSNAVMLTMTVPMPITDAHPFNERLRKFRESLGFSRAVFAAELGVSPITLYRWETGSTRPSPLAWEKLDLMGFGVVTSGEAKITTVPRLKYRVTKERANAVATKLRELGTIELGTLDRRIAVLPAPFVRNGPPDQAAFHRRLLDLQIESTLRSRTCIADFRWLKKSKGPAKRASIVLRSRALSPCLGTRTMGAMAGTDMLDAFHHMLFARY